MTPEVRYVIERWQASRRYWDRPRGKRAPAIMRVRPEGWALELVVADRSAFRAAWGGLVVQRGWKDRPRRARCVLIDDGGRELRQRVVAVRR